MGGQVTDTPRVIGERYAIHGEIATGGMATVHLGRLRGPEGFARTVAIKSLHPHLARNHEFVEMFLAEARLSARVRHPNVVSTLDVVTDGGEVFLVMDYVLGESMARLLHQLLAGGAGVPPAVATGIMAGVLNGLHAAHETCGDDGRPLGLVHRDVTPHNILVGLDGVARVVDFGIAKANALRGAETSAGVLKGTLGYLAPEQLRGEPVDRRTDVYAAAVVLWEALTGRPLFRGGNNTELILERIRSLQVEAPGRARPGLPPELDAIVMRGIARNPDDRWQTARELALALEGAVAPATPSQIGAWVESVAGEVLRQRARDLAAMESRPESEPDPAGAFVTTGTLSTPALAAAHGAAAPETATGAIALDLQDATTPGFRAGPPAAPEPEDAGAPRGAGLRTVLVAAAVMLVVGGATGLWLARRACAPDGRAAAVVRSGGGTAQGAGGGPVARGAGGTAVEAGGGTAAACAPRALADVVALTSGVAARHTCALGRGGAVTCWGDNAAGQLGTGDLAPAAVGVPTQRLDPPALVAAGTSETCAVHANGRASCWGKGLLPRPRQVTDVTGATRVTVGGSHACVLHAGGTVSCWGDSDRGQLGRAGERAAHAALVEGLAGVTDVSAGTSHACAVSGGQVRCWGDNRFGQLGRGSTDRDPHPQPVLVAGLPPVVEVTAGDKTTFARTADGAVYGWGFGIKRAVKVPIDDVVQVAAGGKQSCAVRRDGTVACWGLNDFGQLGATTAEDSALPLVVAGLPPAARVAVGDVHACALSRAGTVACWGGNDAGQLGRGTRDHERHPAPAPALARPCP